ncbi:MAG: PKD domain-containing protein [Campylobacterota bacterium]|nr:PKD domain-containing protein [Campylobacterota bacterium]
MLKQTLNMRRVFNVLLSFMIVLLLSNCSNKNGNTLQEIAIMKIASYAQDGELAPILQDYIDAQTEGMSADKLDTINAFILDLTYEDVDTVEEIQAVIDQFKLEIQESKPKPTVEPTGEPTPLPTQEPQPSSEPTAEPSAQPSNEPTTNPTVEPTQAPVVAPTVEPTPTPQPVVVPTVTPTPTVEPTPTATPQPTVEPTVEPTPNTAPVVDAGSDQSVELGQSVSLSATASDSDGDTMSYEWSQSGTPLATTLSFEYTPSSEGNHTLSFRATDENNASASDSVTIEVTEECDPLSQFVGAC